MKRFLATSLILIASFGLQACITKVVTVPVKVAYGTTKAVVKGTGAVVGAVIPDGDKQDDDKK
ncbi:MAG: hypothetical protein EOO68_20105 [Moraxellaceae bacterium]|nr:MAG: hypothetical protein EOO68_20105 [Moraxellaceae bacterium]